MLGNTSTREKKRCAASVSPRIVLGEGRAFVSLNFISFDVRLYPRGGAKRRRVCVRVCVWVWGGESPLDLNSALSMYGCPTVYKAGCVKSTVSRFLESRSSFDSLTYPLGFGSSPRDPTNILGI